MSEPLPPPPSLPPPPPPGLWPAPGGAPPGGDRSNMWLGGFVGFWAGAVFGALFVIATNSSGSVSAFSPNSGSHLSVGGAYLVISLWAVVAAVCGAGLGYTRRKRPA